MSAQPLEQPVTVVPVKQIDQKIAQIREKLANKSPTVVNLHELRDMANDVAAKAAVYGWTYPGIQELQRDIYKALRQTYITLPIRADHERVTDLDRLIGELESQLGSLAANIEPTTDASDK